MAHLKNGVIYHVSTWPASRKGGCLKFPEIDPEDIAVQKDEVCELSYRDAAFSSPLEFRPDWIESESGDGLLLR